jgi:hypothetical protein
VPGVSAAQESGSTTTNPDRDQSDGGTTDRTCPDKDNNANTTTDV